MRPRQIVSITLAALILGVPAVFAQQGAADGEWRSFAGDLGSTKYSGLDQIDADNVGGLQLVWSRAMNDGY